MDEDKNLLDAFVIYTIDGRVYCTEEMFASVEDVYKLLEDYRRQGKRWLKVLYTNDFEQDIPCYINIDYIVCIDGR